MEITRVLVILALLFVFVGILILVLFLLLRKAKSKTVRLEKVEVQKSLGEVLKQHRTRSKMTQEFVAESLGVSRQAVSKWESGASDPSTSNLLALAKLFGVTADEILKLVADNP